MSVHSVSELFETLVLTHLILEQSKKAGTIIVSILRLTIFETHVKKHLGLFQSWD